MTTNLAALYGAAVYEFKWQARWHRFAIGQRNMALDRVLRRRAALTWCFITASNPASRQLRPSANRRRERHLAEWLRKTRLPILPARSHGPDWPFEWGFIVLGASRRHARQWGVRFCQNAVVWGCRGKSANLLWTAGPSAQ